MESYKEIPFCANAEDGMHCFQASLKMVMKYFWPENNYSWEKLDKITKKVSGFWTWPMAGLIWLEKNGLEVKNIENFDYSKFIKIGSQYLIEEYGENIGNEQIKHSDIDQELNIAKKFIKQIKIERKIPKVDKIKQLLVDDYSIIVNVNSRALNREAGYVGHFIVIKGFDKQGFIINDPGLPGRENHKVDFELFEKAWAYPNEKAKNIIAFRLKV